MGKSFLKEHDHGDKDLDEGPAVRDEFLGFRTRAYEPKARREPLMMSCRSGSEG
jgi:hypothetical protein